MAEMRTTTPRAPDGGGGHGTVRAGFEAGLLGGLAMAAFMMAAAVAEGMGPLEPLAPMGDTFASSPEEGGGAARLLYGLALHLLLAGAIGVVFTSIFSRDFPAVSAAIVGVGLAWVVMGVMTSAVLPAANPSLRLAMRGLGGSWVLAHAVYGATVGVVAQWLRQRGAERAPRAAARRPATV